MPESVVREELESLDIRVQGVTQVHSGRRDQDPAKDCPPTPHLRVPRCLNCDQSPNSAACECRWRRKWIQRAHCNASAARASATRSETADTRPGASSVEAPTSPVGALPHGSSLSAAAVGVTTRRTTAAVLSGKRRRWPLESRRPIVSLRQPPRATPRLRRLSGPGPLPSRWTWARAGITSFEGACCQGHYHSNPKS